MSIQIKKFFSRYSSLTLGSAKKVTNGTNSGHFNCHSSLTNVSNRCLPTKTEESSLNQKTRCHILLSLSLMKPNECQKNCRCILLCIYRWWIKNVSALLEIKWHVLETYKIYWPLNLSFWCTKLGLY